MFLMIRILRILEIIRKFRLLVKKSINALIIWILLLKFFIIIYQKVKSLKMNKKESQVQIIRSNVEDAIRIKILEFIRFTG